MKGLSKLTHRIERIREKRRRLDNEYDIQEYWDWIAVALFLLITVDMLTTLYASVNYGLVIEVNPVVRWALARGPVVLAMVNVIAVVLVVILFSVLMERIRRTPAPYDKHFAIGVEIWLGLLIAVGLLVFANNLAVIILGGSLL